MIPVIKVLLRILFILLAHTNALFASANVLGACAYEHEPMVGNTMATDSPVRVLTRTLLRADAPTPLYNGSISAMHLTWSDGSGEQSLRSAYTYDGVNRLTSASTRHTAADGSVEDYSQTLSYDLNTNVTAMKRYGATGRADAGGLIDDIRIVYDGNRIVAVSDRAPTVLLENALGFREYPAAAATGLRDELTLPRDSFPGGGQVVYLHDPCAGSTPGISPYAFCGGGPINRTDPTGRTIEILIDKIKYTLHKLRNGNYAFFAPNGRKYTGKDGFANTLLGSISELMASRIALRLIEGMIDSEKICTISPKGDDDKTEGSYTKYDKESGNSEIFWETSSYNKTICEDGNGGYEHNSTPETGLIHEMKHSFDVANGVLNEMVWFNTSSDYSPIPSRSVGMKNSYLL